MGFPGETEEEFSTTLGFIRRCGFAQIHVFPYSVRPGTKAADMEQVPKNIKEERAARAGEGAAALHNCLRPVRITAVEGGILKGEIEP